MSTLYSQQSQAAGRHIMPDLVRAFALIGICLVNVGFIAHNVTTSYAEVGLNTPADTAAYFTVTSFFFLKSYTLFSFMFGAGLAYQIQSAQRSGLPAAPRHFRRMFGLLILGVAHVYFAFIGDILIVYAVLGTLLFAFKGVSAKALWTIAIVLYSIGAVLALLAGGLVALIGSVDPSMAIELDSELTAMIAADREGYSAAQFFTTATHRIQHYVSDILIAGLIQGGFAFALFLAGLASVKQGFISDPSHPIWGKALRWGLILGVPLSLISGYFVIGGNGAFVDLTLAMVFSFIAAPFMTMGYLGLIAKWAARPISPVKTFIARGGTASLSSYLLQSLILSFIFCGYGLGYYEKIGAAGTIAIALATALFTIGFSSLWRKYFALGPFEYILRRWTYLGQR